MNLTLQTRFKKANCTVLHIRIPDSAEADLITSFERMCVFIGKYWKICIFQSQRSKKSLMFIYDCGSLKHFRFTYQCLLFCFDILYSWSKSMLCCNNGISYASSQIHTKGNIFTFAFVDCIDVIDKCFSNICHVYFLNILGGMESYSAVQSQHEAKSRICAATF